MSSNPFKSATIDFTMDSCGPSREGVVTEGFNAQQGNSAFYIGDYVGFFAANEFHLKVNKELGNKVIPNGVEGDEGTVFQILSVNRSDKRTPLLGGAHVILKGCHVDDSGLLVCNGRESVVRILDKHGQMDKKHLLVESWGGAYVKIRSVKNSVDCNGTFREPLNCYKKTGNVKAYGFVMYKATPPK